MMKTRTHARPSHDAKVTPSVHQQQVAIVYVRCFR